MPMASSSNDPQIVTLKTIEAALKLIDTKKENLKIAFDDLQPYSSLLSSSVSLSWPQLDSHFTSLQNNLTRRFHRLQSFEPSQNHSPPSHYRVDSVVTSHELGFLSQSQPVAGQDPPTGCEPTILDRFNSAVSRSELNELVELQPVPVQDPSSSNPPMQDRVCLDVTASEMKSSTPAHGVTVQDPSSSSNPVSRVNTVVNRPELISLCEKMDGKGLRNYINGHARKRAAIREELIAGAMQVASDPGAMILDAIEGFYPSKSTLKGNGKKGLYCLRKSCLDLLIVLRECKPNMSNKVKERAKKMALEWKRRVRMKGESPLEALGFLHLVVAYKLENVFDVGELLDFFVLAAKFRQAKALCLAIDFGDKAADLIQKLINRNKRILAVKFIFQFGLTDEFQPIALLKTHLKVIKKFAKKVCMDEKTSVKERHDAVLREVNALRSVLQLIDQHKLGSELPRANLEKRIEMLKKQMAERKFYVPSPDKQQQQQQQQQNGNKRPRTTGPAAAPISISGSSSTIPPFQQCNLRPADLLPGAGLYGHMGSTPPTASYAGSSAGPYGLAGAAMGFPGNPDPAGTHLYFSESQLQSSYYDGPVIYGGYGFPPHYHPTYYP